MYLFYEWIIIGTTIGGTVGVPLCFLILFLDDDEPLRRFLSTVINFKISFGSYTIFFVAMTYMNAFRASININFYCNGFIMYVQSVRLWMAAIIPEKEAKVIRVIRRGRGKSNKNSVAYIRKTPMGYLNENSIIRIYKGQQILNQNFNAIYGFTGFHYGFILVIHVLSSFCCIYLFGKLSPHVYFISVVCFSIACLIVVGEIVAILEQMELSEEFLRVMRKRGPRKSDLMKTVISLRSLPIRTAYPFFDIQRSTTLLFFKASTDFTITLLLNATYS